jgi:hypothetical protein
VLRSMPPKDGDLVRGRPGTIQGLNNREIRAHICDRCEENKKQAAAYLHSTSQTGPKIESKFSGRRTSHRAPNKTSWHTQALWQSIATQRGHSLMVKFQPSKLAMRVRFPLPAGSLQGEFWLTLFPRKYYK